MRNETSQIRPKLLSILLAGLLTVSLGVSIPMIIDSTYDASLASITILDQPALLASLRDTQSMGVKMCLHGWKHEDFSTLNPEEARELVEKGIDNFNLAGLVPVSFVAPYGVDSRLLGTVISAIESTGLPSSLPDAPHGNSTTVYGSYGWEWRTMTSFSDSRYAKALDGITSLQPTSIVLHVEDWNIYLKTLMVNYLRTTRQTGVTIRVDDIEVNTSPEIVYDMADLLQYKSIGLLAYAVIPAGTWRGNDPIVLGIPANSIIRFSWVFFLTTTFFPFSFFLIWRSTSGRGKKGGSGTPSPSYPDSMAGSRVSVIVPAYNEEEHIGQCIESIISQDAKADMEVIVVNDGSTDNTGQIATKYPVKLLDLPVNRGKAQALNIGIQNATGDILVFSDSDSILEQGAVNSLIKCLAEHEDAGAVAGNVLIEEPREGTNLLSHFQMIEYGVEQDINRSLQSLSGSVLVCPGPLFAVRKEMTGRISFSDETVVEDADYTVDMLRHCVKVVREPEARVRTAAPTTVRRWFNQRKRWWYGNLQLWRGHRAWAAKNPWMVFNYFGYVVTAVSLVLTAVLASLYLRYDKLPLFLMRGIPYAVAPIVLFTVCLAIFFRGERRHMKFLLPYTLVYSTLKAVTVSYVYLSYITRLGLKVTFGPRTMRVR